MRKSICQLSDVTLKIGALQFGPFNLRINAGDFIAILGPSGAGKTTLLKLLARDFKIFSGLFEFKGINIQHWSLPILSQSRAVLPQSNSVAFSLKAEIVIGLGRIARNKDIHRERIIHKAARLSRCEHLLDRAFDSLSGGEQARVQLARVFAQLWDQKDGLILVDEPLASLDPGLQIELMRGLRRYAADRHHAIVAILHDINQAITNFERLILVKNGCITNDLTSKENLVEAFETLFSIELDSVIVNATRRLFFPSVQKGI